VSAIEALTAWIPASCLALNVPPCHASRAVALQGANKAGVAGTVKRWHHQTGLHEIDAAAYIELLEKEVQVLRDEFDDAEVRSAAV
jgi:hypothetical protein